MERGRLDADAKLIAEILHPADLHSPAGLALGTLDLMSAFAAAMDAIFQGQNMAVETTWAPQGGAPLPVRAIRKAPRTR